MQARALSATFPDGEDDPEADDDPGDGGAEIRSEHSLREKGHAPRDVLVIPDSVPRPFARDLESPWGARGCSQVHTERILSDDVQQCLIPSDAALASGRFCWTGVE